MSLLVLGLSHRNAPLEVLERAALDPAARADVAAVALAGDHVREILVLSTCNRTEVFAEVTAFHPAVDTLRDALTSRTALNRDDLREHLVLHYDEGAVEHAFSLAAGLDSMAVGEAQILGQLRSALAEGQEREETGPSLNALVQQALRVGKRVHSETEIDTVSRSLVQAGLDRAFPAIGASSPADVDVLVVGAGSMSALAATTAVRAGVRSLTVVNRTAARASDLAQRLGGSSIDIADLADGIARADIVISCTGSTGVVVDLATATDAQIARGGRPQAYLDLALPHDVAEAVDELSGVTRLGLDRLGEDLGAAGRTPEVARARELVAAEVRRHQGARAAERVGPTVAALRANATGVMEAELARLEQRTPDLTDAERAEVRLAVHRVVEKLLHAPTVRVKEMAVDGRIDDYVDVIDALFDLRLGDAFAQREARP